jgi:hypothetical protein
VASAAGFGHIPTYPFCENSTPEKKKKKKKDLFQRTNSSFTDRSNFTFRKKHPFNLQTHLLWERLYTKKSCSNAALA